MTVTVQTRTILTKSLGDIRPPSVRKRSWTRKTSTIPTGAILTPTPTCIKEPISGVSEPRSIGTISSLTSNKMSPALKTFTKTIFWIRSIKGNKLIFYAIICTEPVTTGGLSVSPTSSSPKPMERSTTGI